MIIFNKEYIYIHLYKIMITNWVNKKTIERKWYLIDATDLVLGRLSSFLAIRLRGKHKSS